MFGWEQKTATKLREKRETELEWIKKRFFLTLANNAIKYVFSARRRSLFSCRMTLSWTIPLMAMVATFLTHTMIMKKPLSGMSFPACVLS